MDPITMTVDPTYPRPIYQGWTGIPDNIDAALAYKNDVYIFKGDNYWMYDTRLNRIGPEYPRSLNADWFNCPASSANLEENVP